jgi:hypothetical protein
MSDTAIIDIWRKRVATAVWLRQLCVWSAGYLFIWGTVALVLRVGWEVPPTRLWWGGPGLVVVALATGIWAWRRRPSRDTARAFLDRQNHAGGLLMSHRAAGHEAWAKRVGGLDAPAVRWQKRVPLITGALAAAFGLAALYVPLPEAAASQHTLDVSRSVEALEEQVKLLEEEKVLDSPEAEQLREQLSQVAEKAKGYDPAKTWEALDHLAEDVERTADEAAELARQRRAEAAAAAALSEALRQGGDPLEAERLGQAMQALAELTEMAGGEPTLDGAALPEDLQDLLDRAGLAAGELPMAGLSPEMLEKLAEAMRGREQELAEMLEALAEAGLGEGAGELGELAEIDPSALLEVLEGEGQCDGQGVLTACAGIRAGRGGISPGPGHAEMVWKDPSAEEGVSFTPELLPPTARDPRDAQMIGTSRATPQPPEDAQGSTGGALTGTRTDGGSANQITVLPRHRGAVQRYFDRSREADPAP